MASTHSLRQSNIRRELARQRRQIMGILRTNRGRPIPPASVEAIYHLRSERGLALPALAFSLRAEAGMPESELARRLAGDEATAWANLRQRAPVFIRLRVAAEEARRAAYLARCRDELAAREMRAEMGRAA